MVVEKENGLLSSTILRIHIELRLEERNQIVFIQSERIELVHQVLSERSFDRVGTHHIVDNGTRRPCQGGETGKL